MSSAIRQTLLQRIEINCSNYVITFVSMHIIVDLDKSCSRIDRMNGLNSIVVQKWYEVV